MHFSFGHLKGYVQVDMKLSDRSVIFPVARVLVNRPKTKLG